MVQSGLSLGIDIGGTAVKVAVLEGEREIWVGKSGEYARPSRGGLIEAVRGAVAGWPGGVDGVGVIGLCVPGLKDERGVIVRAVNVPGLVGMAPRELVRDALGLGGAEVHEFTDAHAAAVDFWRVHRAPGRLLALSMGTGVGACVLDEVEGEPVPLIVTGRGPGQIGQMDVTVGDAREEVPIGPDGGRGTLEGYMGLPALRARYGERLKGALGEMRVERPPLAALVRALRVAHAIYTPVRVALLGGVGMRLAPRLGEIREAVADGLTTLARPDWTLEAGQTEHHAARGAAWLAARATI